MKFIKSLIVIMSIISPIALHGQGKTLTLEDLIPGGKTFSKYRAEIPRQLAWHGDNLTFVKGDTIYIAPMNEKGKPQMLTTLEEINKGMNLGEEKPLSNLRYASFISPDKNELQILTHNTIYIYDFTAKKIISSYVYNAQVQNRVLSPDSKSIAYTIQDDLCLQTSANLERFVTQKSEGIVSGQAVHRNEFGINSGIFWSPVGNLLAFYRMDETMVTDYPLVDVSARIAKLKNTKYPMAGMKSHHVTVGVFNPKTDQTIFLKTGTPKEKYLTNIAWSPDEKNIYIAEVNRGQDTCILKSYDAVSGKLIATLFTETHPKYTEPQNPILFLKKDPTLFIWQSNRDGYNHLYLYDTSGKLKKQITSGNWQVTSIIGFDQKGENLFYTSTEESPIENHIYKLNLKSGKRIKLSKEEGVHTAGLSASGKYIYDFYTSQSNAGKIAITNTETNQTYVWQTANNPYRNVDLPGISIGTVKANDGKTDLYYRMVKPANIEPNKKYPTIVYAYGGPHVQLVSNSWASHYRGWDIYMAQKGYIVFTLDNRGTPNRGFDFENIVHRQLGIVETEDQMSGVEYLKSLPYVDQNRIGVHGWSFGGFMTLNLMLRHPETFKVGVAGGPVTDWKYYEIMYGERYMDSPQENPEGYKETNMVDRAGDLKGRLMLIHGDEDPTVVMQHSLQFLNSAIKKGTHPDFFVYPGHGHNMTGHDRVHLHEHITRYFDDFLK